MARDFAASALGRMLRIGGVATRVGTSLATARALGYLFSSLVARMRRTRSFVVNARRGTEALSELKGAAMEVGQMLSAHEGLLPPEVYEVFQGLQRDAPFAPFERMRAVLEASGTARRT